MADGGMTDVRIEGLRELGSGLTVLADTLGGALRAVDTLPIDEVAPVLGPVGADFTSALVAATARHRDVLAGVARVSDAAGRLVLETSRLYEDADSGAASAIGAAAPVTEV